MNDFTEDELNAAIRVALGQSRRGDQSYRDVMLTLRFILKGGPLQLPDEQFKRYVEAVGPNVL